MVFVQVSAEVRAAADAEPETADDAAVGEADGDDAVDDAGQA